ncbi:coronin-6 [Aureobasidium pullulans]|uniref:Coronin n=1 Tax=Aureobasidium pullulans TaxID=5580 RepID=A0AB74J4D4_AURPU|nr:coronin-6 [Aureobasidium pullulans]
MSGRFVRASKYRHVFGQSTKKEQCYDNLRISKNAWDTNLIKANPKYLSVNWEASGGGAFAVIPVDERGKLPDVLPLFRGHTAAVLDTDWNPFDDSIIASGSDDGKVFIWQVPEDFSLHTDADEPTDVSPVAKLSGHTRKVGHVLFNPSAANVLASSSGDCTIKLWDLASNNPRLTLKHNDIVQSLSWSADGGMLVTTCRDKKIRFWDVRQERPAHEVQGHPGAKNSRAVWMGEHDRVATTGFSRMSDRQLGLWDVRNPKEPIGGFSILDSISGVCMPFWDDGTQMLYLAGKGDGNIRYYEYENDKFEYLSEYKSGDPQRGIAFVPKRGVNLHQNEVMRAYKTVNENLIEPISFIVPRRAEVFQNDIYPPATGSKPSMSSEDWFSGKEAALPPKISLESVYEGETPVEIPAEKAPSANQVKSTPAPGSVSCSSAPTPAAASTPTPASPAKPEPTPAPINRGSMKDNQVSMAAMADRFADKEEVAASKVNTNDEFDEVPKPVQRPNATVATKQEEKTGLRTPPQVQTLSPTRTSSAPAPEPVAEPRSNDSKSTVAEAPKAAPSSTEQPTTASGAAKGAAEGIKGALSEIRGLLLQQAQDMAAQAERIESLAKEVAGLKSRLGE